ncbi:hypothetical protein JST97_00565 [bacterium]|nr:hypothetical protein [bacterium]
MQTRSAFRNAQSVRGIAVITVLLISGVILAFVLGGLNLAAQHLFQVSALHSRHRALCAAEVGVSKAQYELEENPAYAGPANGALEDGSQYSVSIEHVGTKAILHSLGQAGGQSQKLKVVMSLDADTYRALSSKGLLDFPTDSFINGIRSLSDTRSAKGNTHTQGDLRIAGAAKLSVTGLASASGSFDDPSRVVAGEHATGGTATTPNFTRDSLLAVSFPGAFIPASGTVTQNTEVNGQTNLNHPLNIPAGVTVHVKGDLILNQGMHGDGTLVVDGNLLLRGSENLKSDTPKGVLVYAQKDIILAHPSAEVDPDATNGFTAHISSVGSLFAEMPEGVPYLLRQRLPPGAPANVNFFAWYSAQQQSPTPAFTEWQQGDNTTLNPGLPPDVLSWLGKAAAMHTQIEATVNP